MPCPARVSPKEQVSSCSEGSLLRAFLTASEYDIKETPFVQKKAGAMQDVHNELSSRSKGGQAGSCSSLREKACQSAQKGRSAIAGQVVVGCKPQSLCLFFLSWLPKTIPFEQGNHTWETVPFLLSCRNQAPSFFSAPSTVQVRPRLHCSPSACAEGARLRPPHSLHV